MSSCRWLVTGGAGFIGSSIAAGLLARGERVRVLDNLTTGRWSNLKGVPNEHLAECVQADVCDPAATAAACDGVEVIFHEAALCSVPESLARPHDYDRVNVGGTVNLLACAHRAGVRRVVLASSAAVYGQEPTLPKRETMKPAPMSTYAVNKLAGELYLKLFSDAFGIETVALRYFNVFGPRQLPSGAYAAAIPKFIYAAVRGQPLRVFGDGEQTRDFCFVQNVVKANLAAAGAPGKFAGDVFNIAGGSVTTLNALIAKLQQVLGRSLDVRYEPQRDGDIRHSSADITQAKVRLGWTPSVGWEDGLRPTTDFLTALAASQEGQP